LSPRPQHRFLGLAVDHPDRSQDAVPSKVQEPEQEDGWLSVRRSDHGVDVHLHIGLSVDLAECGPRADGQDVLQEGEREAAGPPW
jgi:hypothetical protein